MPADFKTDPVSNAEFQSLINKYCPHIFEREAVAIAVSGGPDSMALTALLSDLPNIPALHAITIDHDLRPESGQEADRTAKALQDMGVLYRHKLKWTGEKPQSGLQENARNARYALLQRACQDIGVQDLFLAHHENDQAETFLMRLTSGSGLSGLGAMKPVQKITDDITLVRPLLDVPKERLIATCRARNIHWIEDSSNINEKFERVRLRKAWTVLEREGLSAKRLAKTAWRLQRADSALDIMADMLFKRTTIERSARQIILDVDALMQEPEELAFRVLSKAIHALGSDDGPYGPRMEKVETLFDDLIRQDDFRKRTLGGLVFSKGKQKHRLTIEKEF